MNRKVRVKVLPTFAVVAWFILAGAMLMQGALGDIKKDEATLLWPETEGMVTRQRCRPSCEFSGPIPRREFGEGFLFT